MTCHSQRIELLDLVDQAVTAGARRDKACDVIGISSSTLRRWRPAASATVLRDNRPDAIRPKPYNSYTEAERENILQVCNSAEFASLPPSQIVPILADREEYIGSESTLYRVLKGADQLNHRGRSRAKQKSREPSTHVASAPNQVWMMDITWLPSRVGGRFFYLYMVEDLFSRYGVHWEVFESECSEHTNTVIEQAMWREGCVLNPPTLHNDNGSVLTSQLVHQKLQSMGITPSHSRPRVSNDNAYIESLFRTLKYCPMWPSQGFENIEQAREWVKAFIDWYNFEHRHSAIKFVTPAQRHHGEDIAILQKRQAFYEQQRSENPQRWKNKTRDWSYTETVTLNPVNKVKAVS